MASRITGYFKENSLDYAIQVILFVDWAYYFNMSHKTW